MALSDDAKILYVILIFLWVDYLWELYLDIRQYQKSKRTQEVPVQLKAVMSNETFAKARLYSLDKSTFGFVKDAFAIVETTLVIYSGLLAWMWTFSASISPWQGEVATSCIWLLIITTLSTVVELPFTIYHTFVLEDKHGFNKQTASFFALDKLKAYLLSQALSLPIASMIVMIVKYGGDWFFMWLWLAVSLIGLVLLTVWPAYIAPLFDKYTPLPEGELRAHIEQLASDLHFPLGQLYVVEGSKRSAHSNAYFYGLFGSKRIVLFDTLLAQPDKGGCQNSEVLAVLSHELGHWHHGHIIKNIVIMQVNLLLVFAAFSCIFQYAPIYQAIGLPVGVQPVLLGLVIVLQYIMVPYNTFLMFLMNYLSRKFEYEADAFAAGLGKADSLQLALIQLNKDNLGYPIYDTLYSMWHHSHPPLLARIDALQLIGKRD